jgi:hypothetical protein
MIGTKKKGVHSKKKIIIQWNCEYLNKIWTKDKIEINNNWEDKKKVQWTWEDCEKRRHLHNHTIVKCLYKKIAWKWDWYCYCNFWS